MTDDRIKRALFDMFRGYGIRFPKPKDPKSKEMWGHNSEMALAYYERIKDFSLEIAQNAINKASDESPDKPPTASEIVRQCKRLDKYKSRTGVNEIIEDKPTPFLVKFNTETREYYVPDEPITEEK